MSAVPPGRPLSILLVMEHPGVGSLVPALRLLHERGHRLELAYESLKSVESFQELKTLGDECPGIIFTQLPARSVSGWAAIASWLRRSIDYLHYLEPRYPQATKLRTRAARKAPRTMRRLGAAAKLVGPVGVVALRRALQAIERCLLPAPEVERFLLERRPDVLIPAHLLPIGTPHADYLRAARRLGIRTAFPVRGWDNLTNKGLLRDVPDRVLVWNDLQAAEARELHRIPAEKIRLTGAALCDDWFEWEPSRSREEFCAEVGLRADQPIVLYVCSSGFVARDEVSFVRGWVERLRAWGAPFAEAGFLIRPHPLNAAQWAESAIDGPQVRVWPRFGEAPHDLRSRRNFFDSIFHAQAVVGINTTAQIESAIVGRPVHTVLAEEFRETQVGTLHFHHLRAEGFGLLVVGRDFAEHAAQLAASLRGEVDRERNERFLRRFVRPLGLERPARELVVEEVERLGLEPAPSPLRGPVLAPVVRAALAPIAARAGREEASGGARRRKPPTAQLRRVARERVFHRAGSPVVAGPWLGDEVGELLYWIPFLRWLERASAGVHERLFVVCRAESACFYAGIGAALVDLESIVEGELPDAIDEDALQGPLRAKLAAAFDFGSRAFRVLPPALVESTRRALATQDLLEPTKARMLVHEPLGDAGPIAGPGLRDDVLATRFAPEHVAVGAALGELRTVDLGTLDRAAQVAALSRARGFLGTYGTETVLAVLAGADAVAITDPHAPPDADDLRLLSALGADARFGRLHVVEADASPAQTGAAALRLLEAPVEAVAAA